MAYHEDEQGTKGKSKDDSDYENDYRSGLKPLSKTEAASG